VPFGGAIEIFLDGSQRFVSALDETLFNQSNFLRGQILKAVEKSLTRNAAQVCAKNRPVSKAVNAFILRPSSQICPRNVVLLLFRLCHGSKYMKKPLASKGFV
jgi:hypothetical protein